MKSFDPDWLDLRESADHAARAPGPLAAVAAAFAERETVVVADLAAGGGSTVRAVAPRLGLRQQWVLIDNDPALLTHARLKLAEWADKARPDGEALRLERDGRTIMVRTIVHDLAREPLPAAAAAADLVTASALLDLVGAEWLEALVARLVAARRPLYAALTYDGAVRFTPAHPLDGAVLRAFNRHQATDKGFGPALGPDAADALPSAARRRGVTRIVEASSPWRLDGRDGRLLAEFFEGVARAAAETASPPDGLDDWLGFRLATAAAGAAEVGHRDVFLAPSGR